MSSVERTLGGRIWEPGSGIHSPPHCDLPQSCDPLSVKGRCVCVCVHAQLRLSLCNLRNCSLPGSSVHGISQARIPEWVAISFFRRSSDPKIKPMSPALQADLLPMNQGRQKCGYFLIILSIGYSFYYIIIIILIIHFIAWIFFSFFFFLSSIF